MGGECDVLLEGFLTKSPPLNGYASSVKTWKLRWFVLRKSSVLEYYKDKEGKVLKGKIYLKDCERVESGLSFKGKPAFDIVTPKRTYYFYAATPDEEDTWVKAICEQCSLEQEPSDIVRSQTLDNQTTKPASRKPLTRVATMPALRKGKQKSSGDSKHIKSEGSPAEKESLPDVCTVTSNFTPVSGDCFPNQDESGISLDDPDPDICTENTRAIPSALDGEHEASEEVASSFTSNSSGKPTSESLPISIPGAAAHSRSRPVPMSPEDEGVSTSPPLPTRSPSYQRCESEGYATLNSDDFKVPAVDRSKKPRSSRDIPFDPNAPPVDRSRKPTAPLNVSAPIPAEGMDLTMQVPEVTASIKRYSRVRYYAVPEGSVTWVPVPANSLPAGSMFSASPATLSRSSSTKGFHRSDSMPEAHYDYPPPHHVTANYDYPPPARPPVRASHYDYPPRLPQPGLQRSMSTISNSSASSYGQQNAEQNYSYPPHPIPAGSSAGCPPYGQIYRRSMDSRSSISSRSSHSTGGFDDNDGGDYLFTPVDDETEESYEFMAAGVMARSNAAPARPPKPSL